MTREPILGGTVDRFVVIIEKLSSATRASGFARLVQHF